MTPRKTAAPTSNISPSVTPEEGIQLLQRQIQSAKEYLANNSLPENEYEAWKATTRDYLIRAFGSPSQHVNDVMQAGSFVIWATDGERERKKQNALEY